MLAVAIKVSSELLVGHGGAGLRQCCEDDASLDVGVRERSIRGAAVKPDLLVYSLGLAGLRFDVVVVADLVRDRLPPSEESFFFSEAFLFSMAAAMRSAVLLLLYAVKAPSSGVLVRGRAGIKLNPDK